MLDWIQFKATVTLAYTPGKSASAHPFPQLTIPAMIALPLSLQTKGPPESPWQASLPPVPGYPAQSIELVILPPYAELHLVLVIAGTLTY